MNATSGWWDPRHIYADGRLRWAALDLTIRASEAIELPDFPGSTLRGVLGHGLRQAACLVAPPVCGRCRFPGECVYERLFEARTPPDAEVLRTNSHLPAPFLVRSPATGGTVAPGEAFVFGLTLVGPAARALPFVVEAFRRLERVGIGRSRGRFVLERVAEGRPGGPPRTVYEAREGTLADVEATAATDWIGPGPDGSTGSVDLELEFVTPTELVSGGRAVDRPTFRTLLTALVRRLTSLAHFHGDGPARVDVRPWLEAADGVGLVGSDLVRRRWLRWSSRQGRAVPMSGLVGRVRYAAVPAGLLPFVALGGHLHVGKGTTSGLGRFAVEGAA